MKELFSKKKEILKRVDKGDLDAIKAEKLLKDIDSKLKSKTVLK